MAKIQRGLSIGHYALIMVGLVLLAFVGYGTFTYSEFQRLRADMEATANAAAQEELSVVMNHIVLEAEQVADRFADWEEVQQQLRLPRYYAYWRSRRMLGATFLTEQVSNAEVYDRQGEVLARLDGTGMPIRMSLPPPPAYVDYSGAEPSLLVFETVFEDVEEDQRRPLGYVGLRVAFLDKLRESYAYRYVDPQSIRFERPGDSTLTWSELQSALRFTLRENPMDDAVTGLLSGAIVKLSIILGGFALTLFPALVFLIVRPLRAISSHIDRLKDSPGGLILDELAGVVPIAETEKIRLSLNEYQSQLLEVHSSLEEKSQELWTMAHHDALTGTREPARLRRVHAEPAAACSASATSTCVSRCSTSTTSRRSTTPTVTASVTRCSR